MNKYLLMSAAALLGSAGAAHAAQHTFTFGTQYGGSYCDGGTVTTGRSGDIREAAWIHTNNNCYGGTSQGGGLLGKVKGLEKVWILTDNFEGKNYGIYTENLFYTLSRNFTTWTLWICFSGISCFLANTGPLNNAGVHGIKGHGTTSTAAKVAQLLAARRQ